MFSVRKLKLSASWLVVNHTIKKETTYVLRIVQSLCNKNVSASCSFVNCLN